MQDYATKADVQRILDRMDKLDAKLEDLPVIRTKLTALIAILSALGVAALAFLTQHFAKVFPATP